MTENINWALVNWSRAEFALTAFMHWFFIPLTIGMTYIIAFAQTLYLKTKDSEWERIAKFWAKLFGINFALGVGTGIILGLEFGTNWSNYSWIAGDIFGAPLAAEGIMAFFLESTFVAVMFFGWGKVNPKFHLLSCYLVAFGASLSALWILVANAWMNYPVGMYFNPDTARNEMVDFWSVLLSPFAINKFLHTISSCFVIGGCFMIAVSSWYILKKRHINFSKRSLILASTFGLLGSIFVALTGDGSAYNIAQHQPAKLAAMEGLYDGREGAGLVAFGILNPAKNFNDDKKDFLFKVEIPKMLSLLGYRSANAFVPGMNDIIYGNKERGIISTQEKMQKGNLAVEALKGYKDAVEKKDEKLKNEYLKIFKENEKYLGYANIFSPERVIPPISLTFYSFRIMVMLGILFILATAVILYLTIKDKIEKYPLLLRFNIWLFPLSFIASMAGWVVAEVGRQPWTIQDILPTAISTSNVSVGVVIFTFWLFAILLFSLFIAEIRIMLSAIRKGPHKNNGGENHV